MEGSEFEFFLMLFPFNHPSLLVIYKDCGSCGAFVDYAVTKIPELPKDLNINKCHECVSSEGDDKLCNGGILAHQVPSITLWLLLLIGGNQSPIMIELLHWFP